MRDSTTGLIRQSYWLSSPAPFPDYPGKQIRNRIRVAKQEYGQSCVRNP
ncbi:hypothetical protein KBX53_00760 [Micromonospora sp. M51]|nr:hypothetical protein [Micromonospora sp. M51]MBQ1009510.1 hypothetical protein [Micromonospora sp. M51]